MGAAILDIITHQPHKQNSDEKMFTCYWDESLRNWLWLIIDQFYPTDDRSCKSNPMLGTQVLKPGLRPWLRYCKVHIISFCMSVLLLCKDNEIKEKDIQISWPIGSHCFCFFAEKASLISTKCPACATRLLSRVWRKIITMQCLCPTWKSTTITRMICWRTCPMTPSQASGNTEIRHLTFLHFFCHLMLVSPELESPVLLRNFWRESKEALGPVAPTWLRLKLRLKS